MPVISCSLQGFFFHLSSFHLGNTPNIPRREKPDLSKKNLHTTMYNSGRINIHEVLDMLIQWTHEIWRNRVWQEDNICLSNRSSISELMAVCVSCHEMHQQPTVPQLSLNTNKTYWFLFEVLCCINQTQFSNKFFLGDIHVYNDSWQSPISNWTTPTTLRVSTLNEISVIILLVLALDYRYYKFN